MSDSSVDQNEDDLSFREADEFSDLTLKVEDEVFHVHRVILATVSPVWKRMFLGSFSEKSAKEINLPEKKASEVLDLLHWIYPSIQKRVNSDTVVSLLKLADEYQIAKLKRECELTLSQQIGKTSSPRRVLEYLNLAETFLLAGLFDKTTALAGRINMSTLEAQEGLQNLNKSTLEQITRKRIDHLESANKTLGDKIEALQKELDDYKAKTENEKISLNKLLQSIRDAWGVKDSPAVFCLTHCESPHTTCLECNAAIREFVVDKCDKSLADETLEWPKKAIGQENHEENQ